MKTVKMLFLGSPKAYTYDTQEDLKVGEQYTTPSYSGKILEVASIGPKDESIQLPYRIKEIIVGPQPDIAIINDVYVTKVINTKKDNDFIRERQVDSDDYDELNNHKVN